MSRADPRQRLDPLVQPPLYDPWPDAITLDALHEAATEAAMALDRGYAERHPNASRYRRPGLAHERCVPAEACDPGLGDVVVTFIAPGLRLRWAA